MDRVLPLIVLLPTDDNTLLKTITRKNDLFINKLCWQLERGEILHTISIAREAGLTADDLRRHLCDDVLTSLNQDREYIASLMENCPIFYLK